MAQAYAEADLVIDDGPSPGGGVGPGGHPVLPGGLSCEGARARYVEDYDKAAPPGGSL